MKEITNIASRAESVATFPSYLLCQAHFEGISAAKFWRGKILIATGKTLQSYDPALEGTKEVKLPLKLEHPITAIEGDASDLWLGTAGGGLIRISQTGGTPRVFGEQDGFPTPAISALRLSQGRLYIGFGFQGNGAFGWLDVVTGKFTGLMAAASVDKTWSDAVKSRPEVPVDSIATLDGKDFWVVTEIGLQHLDLASKKWSLATPVELSGLRGMGDNCLAVNAKYLTATKPQRCVAICPLPGTQWTCVNLSTNFGENLATSLALDPANPDWLWVGGGEKGRLTLLNLATSKIIAQGTTTSPGEVQWIFATPNHVVFIARSHPSGFHDLYCLNKSVLLGTQPQPASGAEPMVDDPQLAFLQKNFAKFVPVQFQKDANGEALVQRLRVKENLFQSADTYYCGFRFTVPSWLDGNFEWMKFLAKTEAEKNMFVGMSWNIIPESGRSEGFGGNANNYEKGELADYPRLHRQFPYTATLTHQSLAMNRLVPGKTYAIWLGFRGKEVPDIAFAMTIRSQRGTNEFGALPSPVSGQPSAPAKAPPASAEQLRSELESALKAKDRSAILLLIKWEGLSDNMKATVTQNVDDMLSREIVSVKLAPLSVHRRLTNEVNGFRYRPVIPVIGEVDVHYTEQWIHTVLAYGKEGDAFYFSLNVKEKIEAPDAK